jgi:D-arabinose 1-dehydrogenase-like Zn-dependent alcohol dehydrogenase
LLIDFQNLTSLKSTEWLHLAYPPFSSKQEETGQTMDAPTNQAAWLIKAGTPLQVGDAPLPTAGPGELVVKNAAIAINPLDCHMQDSGVFVQQWPAVFGCDVAGEVYEVGPGVQRFKKGVRVIG